MKLSFKAIALIVVVFLIVMFSTCAGCYTVAPYEQDQLFSIQYPYEDFRARSENKSEAFSAMKSGLDTVVSTIAGVGDEKKKEDLSKVEGFGLMPAPYGKETPIDRFSSLKSDKKCTGSQYSTSTGYICMDKETEKLLTTRGGNISGGDSQIGSA
jgi:hypothetical protein